MYGFPHATNSPVVYARADADLRTRLAIALGARQRNAWRVVRIATTNGVVRLEGIVPSFHDRQLILAVTQHVAGVMRVEDELKIFDPPPRRPDEQPLARPVNGAERKAEPQVGPAPNPFHHLPETESLEEILTRWPSSSYEH